MAKKKCKYHSEDFNDPDFLKREEERIKKYTTPTEKFNKGDIIRLVGTEKIGFVVEVLKPIWQYKIFTDCYQICNLYAIEHATENDLLTYQRNTCCDNKISQVTKCKYCGEEFNDENLIVESAEEPGACEFCVKQQNKCPNIHLRKSIAVNIDDFSPLAKEGDWLEVTEWTNGEGFDITMHYDCDNPEDVRFIQLSYDELGIIMNIVNKFGTLPTIVTKNKK